MLDQEYINRLFAIVEGVAVIASIFMPNFSFQRRVAEPKRYLQKYAGMTVPEAQEVKRLRNDNGYLDE